MAILRRLTASLLVVALASCRPAPDALDWDTVEAMIAHNFPGVPSLTTEELAAGLASESRDIILLDAREAAEFDVSHLPGAHHVGSDTEAVARLADGSPDALIVVYCSVGYRSAALVANLIERGYTNAVNLEGSIFRWASETRPLSRGAMNVREVHPYDDEWGTLLPPDLWAYTPRPVP